MAGFRASAKPGPLQGLREHGAKTARERAIDFLKTQLRTETASRWHHPADLLIRVLLEEKRFDAAWAAVRKHGASPGLKESLARASEATNPHEALETYAERVETLANSGGDPAYAEATALITRMAGLRSPAEQTAYIAALKARHGRKRNLIKLLG